MFKVEDIASKSAIELIQLATNTATFANETKSSSVLLSAPLVSLKDVLAQHHHQVATTKYLGIFDDILKQDYDLLRAMLAVQHFLKMHIYGNNQELAKLAELLYSKQEDLLPKNQHPISGFIRNVYKLTELFKATEQQSTILKLGLSSLTNTLTQEEKRRNLLLQKIAGDLFIQSEIAALSKSRDALEVSLSNLFSFGYAMEVSHADPSWRIFIRRMNATYQHTL